MRNIKRVLELLVVVISAAAAGAAIEPACYSTLRDAAATSEQSTDATPMAEDSDTLPKGAVARIGSFRFNHPGGITCLRFMPGDKHLASVGRDGTVRLWDAATGAQIKVIGKRRPPPADNRPDAEIFPELEVSGDGKVLATTAPVNGLARIWNVETGEEMARVGAKTRGVGHGFALNADGTWLSIADPTGSVHLWNLQGKGGDLRRRPIFPASNVPSNLLPTAVAYSPDGKSLITGGGSDVAVKLWTGLDKEPASRRLGIHRDAVLSVAMSSDGRRVVSGGMDGAVCVWDVADAKLLQRFAFAQAPNQPGRTLRGLHPAQVQISADGKIVLAGAPAGEVRIWDVDAARLLAHLAVHPCSQPAGDRLSALSADGKLAALASSSGKIEVHDLATGKTNSSDGPIGVGVLAISPDGKLVAAGLDDCTVRLWELATGRSLHVLRGHIGSVGYLRFSDDGKHLFSACLDGDDRAITMWDVAQGKELRTFAGATQFRAGTGHYVAISGDGARLATGSFADQLLIRDIASERVLHTPRIRAEFAAFTLARNELIAFGFDSRSGKGFTRISLADGTSEPIEPAKPPEEGTPGFGSLSCFGASSDGRYFLLGRTDPLNKHLTCTVFDSETGVARDLQSNPGQLPVRPATAAYLYRSVFGFSRDNWLVAGPGPDNAICVWEATTGTERQRFPGHEGELAGVAFTPDGTKLLTAGVDNTILVWDLGHSGEATPKLDADGLWEALASQDAAKAHPAMRQLTAGPVDALKLIKDRLAPPIAIDEKKIAEHIRDLDSDEFAKRKAAAAALLKLGETTLPHLQKALKDQPSLDLQARLEELLKGIEVGKLTPDQIRAARCVELLERLNTREAKDFLATMSKWPESDSVAKWARGACRRLDAKPQ